MSTQRELPRMVLKPGAIMHQQSNYESYPRRYFDADGRACIHCGARPDLLLLGAFCNESCAYKFKIAHSQINYICIYVFVCACVRV
jgi:hypothetical protein